MFSSLIILTKKFLKLLIMTRLKSGLSQIGGKFRLLKTILQYIPIHEFYLEPFLGSAIVLLNKPRCRYECGNDFDSELINYLLMTREHPKEFDELKQGVFGLVSQEICNRIVNGKLQPQNDLERAYFYYYLNKLSFGGNIWQVRENPPYQGMTVNNLGEEAIENIKANYSGLNQNRAIPQATFHEEDIEGIKAQYRGINLPTVCKEKSVEEAKASFRGVAPKASYKGIGPKTTRPYTNNDCGLLTPLDRKAIKRLRYVNITAYDFRKVYDMFYSAFYERKGLERECFIYADPPYVGTESYYGSKFPTELHQELVDRMLKTPFNFLLSIGGDCDEMYVDPLREAGWLVEDVYVKYSTAANHQKDKKEYLIMNYDITKIPKMIQDFQQDILSFGGEGK